MSESEEREAGLKEAARHAEQIAKEGGDPTEAILIQEAAGQKDLLTSAKLPTKGLNPERCKELGIVVGETVDSLFTAVQLPSGLVKKGSDHAMWSYLKDAEDNEVASMFYKAAFYDRDAFITFTTKPDGD